MIPTVSDSIVPTAQVQVLVPVMEPVVSPQQLCPSAILTVHLNSPCSSVLLTACDRQQLYFIIGKANGEIIFFPSGSDRSGGVTKFVTEGESPVTALTSGRLRHLPRLVTALPRLVTALTSGRLRHLPRTELVAITASGRLHSLDFPSRPISGMSAMENGRGSAMENGRGTAMENGRGSVLLFAQLLHANIAAAHLMDVDGDGRQELIVAMTDRVVRTYRFVDARLMPLNKWELPSQICGVILAIHPLTGGVYGILSQASQQYHVRMKFGTSCEVAVQSAIAVHPITSSQLILSPDLVYVDTMNTLTSRIVVIDSENTTEIHLHQMGGPVSAIGTLSLGNAKLRLVVTVDLRGVLLIYGWRSGSSSCSMKDVGEPLARCHVLSNVNHLSLLPHSETSFLVGAVTAYFQVAVYQVNMKQVLVRMK